MLDGLADAVTEKQRCLCGCLSGLYKDGVEAIISAGDVELRNDNIGGVFRDGVDPVEDAISQDEDAADHCECNGE
jgi:hypothetical protein